MGATTDIPSPADAASFSDAAWVEVLQAVDRTYAELVDYQEQLERQNAELEQLRSFMASVLDSVSDVLVVVDRGGLIEQASGSLRMLLGVDEAKLLGRPLSELIVEPARARIDRAIGQVISTRVAAHLEAELATPGGPAPLEISVAPRLDARGKSKGAVLTGRPVGELRRAYSELADSHKALKEAQAHLVRNEKLASLGRLLAGVAHELNNPISFVYANAHALEKYAARFETYFERVQAGASRAELVALREELRLDRELKNLRTAIDGARDGSERVRDIVEDLRRLSSEGSGELTDFDLAATSRIAAHWVCRGAKNPVDITFEGPERVVARGRSGHVQQVVMNLVQNAMDAMAGQADGHITLRLGTDRDRAFVEVSDTGPGVPSERASAIFDPFFTTKAVGKGTGLGLAISHKIAEEHGGTLSLRDDGGPGACFRLELPGGTEA